MKSGWKLLKLKDIATIISGVNYDKADIGKKLDIRVLRGSNIQNGDIIFRSDDVFLPSSYKDNRNSIQYGDTCITASTGSIELLGKAATCFNTYNNVQIGAFLRIIRPKDIRDAVLISCIVRGGVYSQYIQRINGTSINNITKEYLEDLPVFYPDQVSHRSITNLAFAIDRKIAINRSINHNLRASREQSKQVLNCRGAAVNADFSRNLEPTLDHSLKVAEVRLVA